MACRRLAPYWKWFSLAAYHESEMVGGGADEFTVFNTIAEREFGIGEMQNRLGPVPPAQVHQLALPTAMIQVKFMRQNLMRSACKIGSAIGIICVTTLYPTARYHEEIPWNPWYCIFRLRTLILGLCCLLLDICEFVYFFMRQEDGMKSLSLDSRGMNHYRDFVNATLKTMILDVEWPEVFMMMGASSLLCMDVLVVLNNTPVLWQEKNSLF